MLLLLLLAACSGAPGPGADPSASLARLAAPGALPAEGAGAWEVLRAEGVSEAADAQDADAWSWLARGEAARGQGRFDAAGEAFVRVVEAAPSSPAAEVALVRLLGLQGQAPAWARLAERAAAAVREARSLPDAAPSAFARYQAARLGLRAGREVWVTTDDAAPFDGSPWGAPTQWRVLGPFSLHPHLDTLEPPGELEAGATLPDQAELLGFTRRTQRVTSGAEIVALDGRLSGVYVAETFITTPRAVTLDVAGYFQGLGAVWIDGVEILRRDDRAAFGPLKVRAQGVELGPGIHQVRVRVGVERGYAESFGLTFLPDQPGTPLRFTPARPDGDAGRVLAAGRARPWLGTAADLEALPQGLPGLYAAAVLGAEVQEEALTRAALQRLASVQGEASPLVSLLQAELVESLWSLPSDVRAREQAAHLRAARSADPSLVLPLLDLAKLWRAQDLKEDATRASLRAAEERPDQVVPWMEAAAMWRWRGLNSHAEDALQRALALEPARCEAAQDLLLLQSERLAPPDALPDAWAACDLARWRFATYVLAARGEPEESLRLKARDVARYPDRLWTWTALAEAQRQHLGPAEALKTTQAALQEHPNEPALAVLQADLLDALGRKAEAAGLLRAALAEHPTHWDAMRRLALLEGRLPLEDLMGDGEGAIKAWKASPVAFPSAAVYVLDYMGRRYFEDGSSADVTHIVIQVQNKEGIDEFGEVKLPSGAIPLRVRTIKRSGEVVEPELQQGKAAISMPSLDPGDFIEYAYLTLNGYVPTRRGALVGPDFYFKMSNIASNHSQLIVEVPLAWEPDFIAWNGPPPGRETVRGAWRRYDFLQTRSAQPRGEPDSVENAEYLPHVQPLYRYTWADALRYEQNQLAGAQATSPLLAAQARQLTAGLEGQRAKAQALFDFTRRHVRSRAPLDLSTPAAHVLARGEGNPAVLLQALLREAGITSTLWRVRPTTRDPMETALPTLSRYAFMALRAEVDGEEVWMAPVSDYAPFDYLPEEVQGCAARSVEPGADPEPIQTPRWDSALERRDVQITLRVSASGDLEGEIVETTRGARAAARRTTWAELASDDKVRKHIERLLGYDFSGAELVDYQLEGRDTPEEPLVLRYRLRRAGYARPQGDALVIEDRYDLPDLTRRFARLPDRTVPMLLDARIDEAVSVRLEAPPGFRIEGPGGPDEVRYEGAFGAYERAVQRDGATLWIRHHLTVPIQRIQPDQYNDFSDWTGDVDRATYGRVVLKREAQR